MLYLSDNQSFSEMIKGNARKKEGNVHSSLSREWVTPVTYKYDSWPLSICPDGDKHVVIGTSNGRLQRINMSVDDMASTLKSRMKRGLTRDEWNQYVGNDIPYINLK